MMAAAPRIRSGSPAGRPHRSGASTAILLALAFTLAPAAAGSHAQGPPARQVYLPRLDRLAADGAPEACVLAAADWECPNNGGWHLSCGGMGAIRELISLQDAAATVLAVGDGVARFRLTDGQASWTAQLGGPLTGLGSAALGSRAEAQAWAAGAAGRLALQARGCWQPSRTRNPDLDLRAIRALKLSATANYFGWAIGARCPSSGQACRGAVIHLDHPDDPMAWVDQAPSDLPPLSDVVLRRSLAAPGDPRVETWMVGGQDLAAAPATGPRAGAQADCRPSAATIGLFLRAPATAPLDLAPLACLAEGRPQELTLTSMGGLALGAARLGGDLLGWTVDARSGAVEALAEPIVRGRMLSDLYYANLDPSGLADLPRLWMGLAPADGASVVMELGLPAAGPPQVEPLGLPEALAEASTPASVDASALAPLLSAPDDAAEPLELRGLLYAWGDGVWLRDQQSAAWSQVRRRRDLVALAADAGQLLALSVEGGRGRLLRQGADGLREVTAYSGFLDRRPAPRALLAAHGAFWLAGDDGFVAKLDGMGAAAVLPPPPSGADGVPARLTSLAAAPDGGLWVLAEDATAQRGRLWHLNADSGRWSLLAESGPLRGLAAGIEEEVWAVGPGRALWSAPGCEAPAPAAPWSCGCQGLDGVPRRVCRLEPRWPLDLRAVAPEPGGGAWAVTGRDLLWLSPPTAGGPPWRYPRVGAPLQPGQEIQGLLRDDVGGSLWVLSRCGRDGWFGSGPTRGVGCSDQPPFWGAVNRFRPGAPDPVAGSWDGAAAATVNVLPHALAQAPDPAGRPAVWLAGDWTTLAYRAVEGVGR